MGNLLKLGQLPIAVCSWTGEMGRDASSWIFRLLLSEDISLMSGCKIESKHYIPEECCHGGIYV